LQGTAMKDLPENKQQSVLYINCLRDILQRLKQSSEDEDPESFNQYFLIYKKQEEAVINSLQSEGGYDDLIGILKDLKRITDAVEERIKN